MSGFQCNKCGSTNIDTDSPSGNVVCIACGNVLEDSGIVSEVQYAQDSRGASRAVGQLVSYEGKYYTLIISVYILFYFLVFNYCN